MRILILTDNPQALELARELRLIYSDIDIFQSPNGSLDGVLKLNVTSQVQQIISEYDLVISIHCKQIFPVQLTNSIRCINIHPGFNPFNRGWFPHVFSIINGLKAGVTIHEMDEQIDHGRIIAQREYKIESWDTSETAYAKIIAIERDLLLENFNLIREGTYDAFSPEMEGNVNLKRDFEGLRRIDLDKYGGYREFLNHLRALSHGDHKNAYFIDETGQKVFVRVILDPEIPPTNDQ